MFWKLLLQSFMEVKFPQPPAVELMRIHAEIHGHCVINLAQVREARRTTRFAAVAY